MSVRRCVCQGMDEIRGLFVINSFDFSRVSFSGAVKQLLMSPFLSFLECLLQLFLGSVTLNDALVYPHAQSESSHRTHKHIYH